ncbi:MAG: hypothetical protein JSU77_06540 [Fidelibacterota bacterium]|nr:MAG: hypothetical protein JSU77_06540 [Candidatus Neomarinimicrobiota bacterium]
MRQDDAFSLHSNLFWRIIWYIVVGVALYWVGNVVAVFPWLISRTLGIIAMIASTLLWAYVAFYCLRHVQKSEWNMYALFMASIFLATAAVQDYFLYAVYRGIPDELYVTSTFIAYGLVFALPFIVRLIMRNYQQKAILVVSLQKIGIAFLIGVVSFLITIWSIRYW